MHLDPDDGGSHFPEHGYHCCFLALKRH